MAARIIRTAVLASVAFSGALVGAEEPTRELRAFLRQQMGLSDDQIAMIAHGTAVVRVLPTDTPNEIFVFGAVFVNAAPEEYAKLAFNVDRLRKLPNYMGIGRVGSSPALSDLGGFTLEPDDIRDLKDCRPGKCGVQLPVEAMRDFQREVNWSGADVAVQVNDKVRRMAVDFLRRYQKGGNSVLGTYGDQEFPFDVRAQLQSWLGRSEVLTARVPELKRYLLEYPNGTPTDVESSFYWEKVNFGLKPTLRLNHAITYRSGGPGGSAHVVAVKQLYASHYFQLALDVTACVTDSRGAGDKGFYLINLRGSTQQGLTGFTGSLLRRTVVSKTSSAQEKALIGIKRALEGPQ
jgi:hypothetical protein